VAARCRRNGSCLCSRFGSHGTVSSFGAQSGTELVQGSLTNCIQLDTLGLDNFGDCEPVGEGVLEMRIHYGPGFRVYFVRHGAAVYVLLSGGDKSSQRRDIARAKRMARELKESGR
jgi:putative addiction module killer protein